MTKTAKTKKTNKKSTGGATKIAIGAGIAAVGAGAYYLLGPDGKANQKKAKVLMNKISKDVKTKSKKAKDITTPIYHKVVDMVTDTYAEQYKAHEKDIKAFAKKLKSEWKKIG